jgi:hypothetical protein
MTMYGTGAATAPRTSQNGQTGHGRAPAVAMPKTRRRTGLAVVGVVLLLLGALAGVRLVASAGDRLDVLSVARDVPLGATITGADLQATYVSVDPGIATVSASEKAAIVGQVAATHLVAGSLLAPGQVAKAGPPAAGQVLVPLAVPGTGSQWRHGGGRDQHARRRSCAREPCRVGPVRACGAARR